MSNAVPVGEHEFCTDDERFAGAVEVVEIPLAHGRKTIGLRLRVGNRFVHLARHRTDEVVDALRKAAEEASNAYKTIIEEMNP